MNLTHILFFNTFKNMVNLDTQALYDLIKPSAPGLVRVSVKELDRNEESGLIVVEIITEHETIYIKDMDMPELVCPSWIEHVPGAHRPFHFSWSTKPIERHHDTYHNHAEWKAAFIGTVAISQQNENAA